MNIIPLGTGKCSFFGGPMDSGVAPAEGLSCIGLPDLNDNWFRRLFLSPGRWDNSKGLARNLDPQAFYCAMRWAYGTFQGIQGDILRGYSEEQIRRAMVIVEANDRHVFVQPADWGPSSDTGRLIDLSVGACKAIGVTTDDVVKVSAII